MDPVPDLVTLHLWGVPDRRVPAALLRMARDRGPLRRTPGLRFAKLLGTGDGRTFTVRDADRNHWGAAGCLGLGRGRGRVRVRAGRPGAGAGSPTERLRVDLRPLASRGCVVAPAAVRDPEP